jgi:hypothetical protein
MFGSSIVDIAIGIIFTFLLVSLITSTVNEIILSYGNLRGKELLRGIQTLLNDGEAKKLLVSADGLVKDVYNHGHLYGLFQGEFDPAHKKGDLPSYIPSRNFALALLDTVPKKAALARLKDTIATLSSQDVKSALLARLQGQPPAPAQGGPATHVPRAGTQPPLAKPVTEMIRDLRKAASSALSASGLSDADKASLSQMIGIAGAALGEELSPALKSTLEAVADAARRVAGGAGAALAFMTEAITPTNAADLLQKLESAAQNLSTTAPELALLIDAAKSEADPVHVVRRAALVIDAKVGEPLIAMIKEVHGDLDKLVAEVEGWYNSAMDRVSGWYKYKTQWYLFWLGLGLAVILNVNTVIVVQTLSRDATMRQAIVAAAQQYVNTNNPRQAPADAAAEQGSAGNGSADTGAATSGSAQAGASATGNPAVQSPSTPASAAQAASPSLNERIKSVHDQVAGLEGLGLPIGWSQSRLPHRTFFVIPANARQPAADHDQLCQPRVEEPCQADEEVIATAEGGKWVPKWNNKRAWTLSWVGILIGWLITAFAVSLGAPFWFDLLNKFMVVRSTVKPREKSQEEPAKD